MKIFSLLGFSDRRRNTRKNSQTAPSPSGATGDRNLASENPEPVRTFLAQTNKLEYIPPEEKGIQNLASLNQRIFSGFPG